jgi:hypothetical protein
VLPAVQLPALRIDTPRAFAAPRGIVSVLVASKDPRVTETLTARLPSGGRSASVRGVLDLCAAVQGAPGERTLVVVDGAFASVPLPVMIAVARELPKLEVVVCRPTPGEEELIVTEWDVTSRWIVLGAGVPIDRVAAECARIVG